MKHVLLVLIFILFTNNPLSADSKRQKTLKASNALVRRLLPNDYKKFKVGLIEKLGKEDVFEVEAVKGLIAIRGNNGVSIASALYHYLTNYAGCQVTWKASNLKLPKKLVLPPKKVRISSPHRDRYYLNYCTFGYSMPWWNWKRWEKEIDWMALHGINMPLAVTGQEAVIQRLFKSFGFTDSDLKTYFPGPAYLPWFRMGNMDGQLGGPLPQTWIDAHVKLQRKILIRERSLGMKPILTAFNGHVPAAFKKKFPEVKTAQFDWVCGKQNFLSPEEPLFKKIGKKYIEIQTKLYGTDHIYSTDVFNEQQPKSNDPKFITDITRTVYESMSDADPKAVWVMQGWMFRFHPKYWKKPQIKGLFAGVPKKRIIVLDLDAAYSSVWNKTEGFYNNSWIWCMLHNFGGRTSLYGNLEITNRPVDARNHAYGKNMTGIGLSMEAIEQNAVMYELMQEQVWSREKIDTNQWLKKYGRNRYGVSDKRIDEAWSILKKNVYKGGGFHSFILARPTFSRRGNMYVKGGRHYNINKLSEAVGLLLQMKDKCATIEGYRYDIVDFTRQLLTDKAYDIHAQVTTAYRQKNLNEFRKQTKRFLTILDDIDYLLGTRKEFMLSTWINDARSWGTNDSEKKLYEYNARRIVTMWAPKGNQRLYDYSCRNWNGLIRGFYKIRWQMYFKSIEEAFVSKTAFNGGQTTRKIIEWEEKWISGQEKYPTKLTGDSIVIAQRLFVSSSEMLVTFG